MGYQVLVYQIRGLVPPHLNLLDAEPHAQPRMARMWFASQLPSNSVGDVGTPSSLMVTESFPSWGFYKGAALKKKKIKRRRKQTFSDLALWMWRCVLVGVHCVCVVVFVCDVYALQKSSSFCSHFFPPTNRFGLFKFFFNKSNKI